jgi:asparagine synthase (glutamine-hydrolysing)
VTVALSGDAGDELFGGYNRYLSAAFFERRMRHLPAGLRRLAGGALRQLPVKPVDAVAAMARSAGIRKVPPMLGEKLARIGQFMAARSGIEAYLGTVSQWIDGAPVRGDIPAPHLRELANRSLPQQMMWWDMQTYLTDDILVKVDRAAMSVSLETRVPLLDHRVVELAWRLPPRMKLRGGQGKWLLRRVLDRYVPRALVERPKQGFAIPLDSWLRGPLREWAETLLEEGRLRREGFLDHAAVRRRWQEHLSGARNWQYHLWIVLMFQAWLDRWHGTHA